ncbi:putative proteinconserved [Aphelenchoides avenae]|nr:putative proteinconserved [Aphelenchus avenae]
MDLPKIAECPVCLELFTEPKVLGCGHCFCKKCINATPRGLGFTLQPKVTCPECRQESSVPACGFPTNYRLLDIVSNLESAGFRNTKDCGGCGRKTPKAELFSCTTCQAEVGTAEEVIICSLCFMNAHKAHDFVRYNKATQRDVDEARNKVSGDRVLSQKRVDNVREELDQMTHEIMQVLEARAPKHVEIHDELGGALRADATKDDIEAKVNQSNQHADETANITLEMKLSIQSFRRQLQECIQKKGEVSLGATAKSPADQPSTSAAAARPPREFTTRSDVVGAWEHYVDHFGGDFRWPPYRLVQSTTEGTWDAFEATSPRPMSPIFHSSSLGGEPVYLTPSPPRANDSVAAQPSSLATTARSIINRINRDLEERMRDRPVEGPLMSLDGAASSSGTAVQRNIPQEPVRGRSPPSDPRRQTRWSTPVVLSSSDEENHNVRAEATVRTTRNRWRKRARRDGDN